MRTERWHLGSLAAVVAAGLLTLVGSGGGFPDMTWNEGDFDPLPTVSITPLRLIVQAGVPARFTAIAGNVQRPSYRWCLTPANAGQCEPLVGATGDTLTLPSPTLAQDGATVQVQVDDANGVVFAYARLFVSAAPPIEWRDGDFAAGPWSVAIVAEPAVGGPSATVSTADTGGHPGAWRRTVVQIPGGASALRVEQWRTDWIHDPGTQGAIRFVSAQEDCQTPGTSTTNAYIATVPMLLQGGRRYLGLANWSVGCSSADTWVAGAARIGMAASDFQRVDGPACGTGESCPDFGSSGSPIQFGFAHRVDTSAAVTAGERTRGIDNWQLTIWRQ